MSKQYSVKQLAELSGVTIRALHHYDHIGLLKPAVRTEKKYRLYDHGDCLRLQQVLFYRELGFSLLEIRDLLDDPDFNTAVALHDHRKKLVQRQKHMTSLIQTVDRTLALMEGEDTMTLKDKDLYQGFDREKIDRWNREVEEKYDPETVEESRSNLSKMSKAQFAEVQKQGDRVTLAIAELMDKEPNDPDVQAQIKLHHAWVENFYECPLEMYRGLGQLYIENPEFTAFYEKIKPGLATFMAEAMAHFADNEMRY
ncbi:MAG: MerR family transcriptional regulator [Candidatus Marinimicrobia bacterium]|nr:MerR family transcriptional regulator [Candidatus Neomarinimicrobiota bacterium]